MSIGLLTMCIGLTITVREVRILKRVYIKRSTNHVYIKEFTKEKCVYIKKFMKALSKSLLKFFKKYFFWFDMEFFFHSIGIYLDVFGDRKSEQNCKTHLYNHSPSSFLG